jgi:hypothetical protein
VQERLEIRSAGGHTLKEKWAYGPRTYLGLQTAGFPTFFMAMNAAFCNYTVCAESIVEWITEAIGYVRDKGLRCMAPTPEAEEGWMEYINKVAAGSIFTQAKSAWSMRTNIPGKPRAVLLNPLPAPAYRAKCTEAAAKGYEDFVLQ